MFKSLLLVFAVLAVASAQYIASPYSTYSAGAYPAYSGVSAYSAYPAYSGVSTYGAYPYAYSGLGYGSSYLVPAEDIRLTQHSSIWKRPLGNKDFQDFRSHIHVTKYEINSLQVF
ncbi:hypothetical protein FOCC_FOCC017297 [Frankliniella occidentalis]|nr:hypothetical protein FOCC_FOCC017297 [Frankliniella occidentalis]